MKVIVFGASGIIGLHMRLCVPEGVSAAWVGRQTDPLNHGFVDLGAHGIDIAEPVDAVVNLIGASDVDYVESQPNETRFVNIEFPEQIARWCQKKGAHYVHVSTQAVFSGAHPPYHPGSQRQAVNEYGRQKIEAEQRVERVGSHWTIVRPTFVLGVRPLPMVGRRNPVEAMLEGSQTRQVNDRWFSPAFAIDVAEELWRITLGEPQMKAIHVGTPIRVSRYVISTSLVGGDVEPVSHDSFPGIAPRPIDTTYAADARHSRDFLDGLVECADRYTSRESMDIVQRAREIALFLGKREDECLARLSEGFEVLHPAVAADFRSANPQGDEELLDWYRKTEAYIWELSAYHCDPRFNYMGMCKGVSERLKTEFPGGRVLCLGDGIGDLSMQLARDGFESVYHDLAGSRTAAFARFRRWAYMPPNSIGELLTDGWEPPKAHAYDAVVSFDYLEHCVGVPKWTQAIYDALKPGGLFMCQNAFNCGSGPQGSIPMHLTENDRYEKEWDDLCASIGFVQESSNWYRKPA